MIGKEPPFFFPPPIFLFLFSHQTLGQFFILDFDSRLGDGWSCRVNTILNMAKIKHEFTDGRHLVKSISCLKDRCTLNDKKQILEERGSQRLNNEASCLI
jgi:hypothetical protein